MQSVVAANISGDGTPKDPVEALAWAIVAASVEFKEESDVKRRDDLLLAAASDTKAAAEKRSQEIRQEIATAGNGS
jgi:hypothetical protein